MREKVKEYLQGRIDSENLFSDVKLKNYRTKLGQGAEATEAKDSPEQQSEDGLSVPFEAGESNTEQKDSTPSLS